MQKVFSSEDRFLVTQVRDMLESKGITCFVKNEFAIGGAGELSPFDTWPEVWISDDEWLPKAKEFVAALEGQHKDGDDWLCPECGESNAASFEVCWQCSHEKPEA